MNLHLHHINFLRKAIPLIAFSGLICMQLNAQKLQNVTYATASATIITEMAGAEKLDDIHLANIFPGTISSSFNAITVPLKIINNDYAYSVSAPAKITTQKKEGPETIILDSFTINISANKTLKISCRANSSNAACGVYTSTSPVNVTIHYN